MLTNRSVRVLGVLLAVAMGSLLIATERADAGHFRFGRLTWVPVAGPSDEAELTFIAVFETSAFGFTVLPSVGDIVSESVGLTELLYGDGFRTGVLDFEILEINTDWFLAKAVIAPPDAKTGTVIESLDANDTTTEVDICGANCEIDVGESFDGELSPVALKTATGTVDETEPNDALFPLPDNASADEIAIGNDYHGVFALPTLAGNTGTVAEIEVNDTLPNADVILLGNDYVGELTLGNLGAFSSLVGEAEPNNSSATANGIAIGNDFVANLADLTDVDFLEFKINAPVVIAATLELDTLASATLTLCDDTGPCDPSDPTDTSVLNSAGTPQEVTALTPALVFALQDPGTYFLRVEGPGSCCSGTYTVELREVLPGPLKNTLGESESNDTSATADAIGMGDRFQGVLTASTRGPASGVVDDETVDGLEPNDEFGDAHPMDIGDDFDGDIDTPVLKAAGAIVNESEGNDSSGVADGIALGNDFKGTLTGTCDIDPAPCTTNAECPDGGCTDPNCDSHAGTCSVALDCDQSCVSTGDVDFATFTVLMAGDTISAVLSSGSAVLELLDTDSSVLATGPSILYTLPTASGMGPFFLKLSEGSLGDYTVELRAANPDIDIVSFDAKEGQIITAKVVLDTLSPDATLELFNPLEVPQLSDSGSVPEISGYTIPDDGTYFLKVTSPIGSGGGVCCNTGTYTLELRSDGDTDIVSFTIAGNETISATLTFSPLADGRLRLLDTDGETALKTVSNGSGPQKIVRTFHSTCSGSGEACVDASECEGVETCDSAAGTYYLEVTTPGACCSGTYDLDLRMQPDAIDMAKFSLGTMKSVYVAMDLSQPLDPFSTAVNESEANGTPGTADSMTINQNYVGGLGTTSDVDVVEFTGTEGQTVSILLDLGTLELAQISLLDDDVSNTLLLNAFGSDTNLPEITFTLPAGGMYFIKIERQPFPLCSLTGCTGDYVLKLRNVGQRLDSWVIDLLASDGTPVLDNGNPAQPVRAEGQGNVQNPIEFEGLAAGNYFLRVRTRSPLSSRGFGPYTMQLRQLNTLDPGDFVKFNASGGEDIYAVIKPRVEPNTCATSLGTCLSSFDCNQTCSISAAACGVDDDCLPSGGICDVCVPSPIVPLNGKWELTLFDTDKTMILASGQGSDAIFEEPLKFTLPGAGTYFLRATSDEGHGSYTLSLRTFTAQADGVDIVKFVVDPGPDVAIQARVVVGVGVGDLSQAELRLLDASGNPLQRALFFSNTVPPLFDVLAEATYYLEISSTTGATGNYTMELRGVLGAGKIEHEYPRVCSVRQNPCTTDNDCSKTCSIAQTLCIDASECPGSETCDLVQECITAGPFMAEVAGCCRLDSDNNMQNCPTCAYRLLTELRFDLSPENSSPVSGVPHVVVAPINTPGFSFFVPAVDAEGDTLKWRFSDATESRITEVIGDVALFEPMINTLTGEVSWNTNGTTDGDLYAMQITIEDSRGDTTIGRSTVDFLVKTVNPAGFSNPNCAITNPAQTSFKVNELSKLTFDVNGDDGDGNVTVSVSGLPAGATMTPGLPDTGDPVSSTFNWTPVVGDAGNYEVTFITTDSDGLQCVLIVPIEVNSLCVVGGDPIVGYVTECNTNTTSLVLNGNETGDPPYTNFSWTTTCVGASFLDGDTLTPTFSMPVNPCAQATVCTVTLSVDDGAGTSDSCTTDMRVCDTFCTDPCDNCNPANTACELCPIDIVQSGTIDQSDLNAAADGIEYGAVSGCFNQSCTTCDECPAADPPPLPSNVTIELVVRVGSAGANSASSLPTSVSKISNGDTFFVDVWAQTDKPAGLAQVTTDILFNASLASAVGITHTTLFDQLIGGSTGAGLISVLTGSHAAASPACSDAVGASTMWARVAEIEFTADAVGFVTFDAVDSADGVSVNAVCGGFVAPTVNYQSRSLTISILGGDECIEPTVIDPNATRTLVGHGGWFQFTAQSNATSIETCGSDFDTLVQVFTGCGGRPDFVTSNDDCNNGPSSSGRDANASCFDANVPSAEVTSCLCLATVPGTSYIIRVTDPDGNPPPDGSTTVLKLTKKSECPSACQDRAGKCFKIDNTRNDLSPGCEDQNCCEIVCALDSFCCTGVWDSICVGLGINNCPNVGACCLFIEETCIDGEIAADCSFPNTLQVNRFCCEGVCTNSPSFCDDDNPCTDDICDGDVGCQFTPNTDPCDDGLFCNGVDTCSSGSCFHSGNPCDEFCDESDDKCHECLNNTHCADEDLCNGDERCLGDRCFPPLQPLECDDGNPCTDDSCDAVLGCQYVNISGSCDDGLFCNGVDTCSDGSCTHTGDPCSASEICEEADDACYECLNDDHCADGDLCNGDERCVGGTCFPPLEPLDCDDANACTDDSCDAVGGCQYINNTDPCDDGVYCNGEDNCSSGSCSHSGNPCLDLNQFCQESDDQCFDCLDDNHCGDGVFCNGDEVCDGGTCRPSLGGRDCDDGVACTADSCDETLGQCDNIANNAACDDGQFCNGVETCSATEGCLAGEDPCPGHACSEEIDECVACAVDEDCDDLMGCNGVETCDTTTHECLPGIPVNCDDGDDCNGIESCDEAGAECVAGAIEDCDNNNIDDSCDMAACEEGDPFCADCNGNGRMDGCDIASRDVDVNGNGIPDECEGCKNNAACDDGSVCTFERCVDGKCVTFAGEYGDLVGVGGTCGPNQFVDLPDILAMLDAFQNRYSAGCSLENMDIAGPSGSCVADGLIDLSDILAVLDAFQGLDRCCANAR